MHALAVALLWTVHPLQTESVTYIVQRAESLVGLMYLLTFWCFIRAAEPGAGGGVAVPLVDVQHDVAEHIAHGLNGQHLAALRKPALRDVGRHRCRARSLAVDCQSRAAHSPRPG